MENETLLPKNERNYQCPICDKTFKRQEHVKTHMMVHTGERPYQCPECESAFTRISHLKSHVLLHSGERPYMCQVCGKTFIEAGNLKQHLVVHTDEPAHPCPECKSSFKRIKYLNKHMLKHTGVKPLEVPEVTKSVNSNNQLVTETSDSNCISTTTNELSDQDQLYETVTQDSQLNRYTALEEIAEQQHQCSLCNKTFTQVGNLKRHMKVHIGSRPYQCPDCDSIFTRNSHLKAHMLIHTGEKPHECQVCKWRFRDPGNLKRHMVTHSENRRPELKENVTMLNCVKVITVKPESNSSEETSSQKLQLESHSKLESLNKHIVTLTGEQSYRGPEVKEKVPTISDFSETNTYTPIVNQLRSDGDTHLKTQTSESRFPDNQVIRTSNCISNTTNELSDQDQLCGTAFTQDSQLERYTALDEIGEQQHPCSLCNKTFTQVGNLKRHLKVHTGSRPYPCPDCNSVFTRNGHLKSHMLIHSGEKPHECRVCKWRFREPGNLKKHMLTHSENRRSELKENVTMLNCVKVIIGKPKSEETFSQKCQLESHSNSESLNKRTVTLTGERSYKGPEVKKKVSTMSDSSETNTYTPIVNQLHSEGDTRVKTETPESQVGCDELIPRKELIYQCLLCFTTFDQGGKLNKHMMVHTAKRPFQCSECNSAFTKKRDLKTHILTHTNEKPHVCQICETRFKTQRYLKRHIVKHHHKQLYQFPGFKVKLKKSILSPTQSDILAAEQLHSKDELQVKTDTHEYQIDSEELVPKKEQLFVCSLCDRTFKVKSNLMRHISVHTGERRYQCKECDSAFSRNSHLKTHILIHKDEKPHACHVCERRFRDPGNLKKHTAIHTNKRPYQCILCGKTFITRKQLKRHILHHTGEKPHSVQYVRKSLSHHYT